MICPQCQQDNPSGARFCNGCGAPRAPLALACAACGHANPSGSRFCNGCGAKLEASAATATTRFGSPGSYTPQHLAEKILTSKSAMEGERKQVTVLFADLKGSMELLADRDPEEARKILDPVGRGFLGFTIRWLRSWRGKWWPQVTPALKQRNDLASALAAFLDEHQRDDAQCLDMRGAMCEPSAARTADRSG